MNYNFNDLLGRKPIAFDYAFVSKYLKGKVVLVTGAAGSIGSEIVRQVSMFAPLKIIMLDQAETPLYFLGLEMSGKADNIEFVTALCDVTNKEAMLGVFKKHLPHFVYHAAAYKHVPLLEENPLQAIKANVLGTQIIANLSTSFKVNTFVFISTDKAVNPKSIMGITKLIAEKYILALQSNAADNTTKYIVTRFGNVLGSAGSVVPVFAAQIEKGGPVTVTHPDISRYFMTIIEACQLVLEAGVLGSGGEIYLFDMGEPIKIADLAVNMIKMAGFEPEKDIQIVYTGLRKGEKLMEELYNDHNSISQTKYKDIIWLKEELPDYDEINSIVDSLISLDNSVDILNINKNIRELISIYYNKNK